MDKRTTDQLNQDIKYLEESIPLFLTSLRLFNDAIDAIHTDHKKSSKLIDMAVRSLQATKKILDKMNAKPDGLDDEYYRLEGTLKEFQKIYFPAQS